MLAITLAAALAAAPLPTDVALPDPVVWAPGLISGEAHEAAPVFAPEGVYFGRSNEEGSPPPTILLARRRGDGFAPPVPAAFSGAYGDMEPALAPDGSHMVFVSNRPAASGGAKLDGHFNRRDFPGEGGALWRVDRRGEGWGAPWRLPDGVNTAQGASFAPAIAADGALFFMRPDPETGRFRLYRAAWTGAAYGAPEPLAFSTGASTDVDPAVAPDGSFLVFGSGGAARFAGARSMDLFIVFHGSEGWGLPVHLGDKVNAEGSDAEPRLSADGRVLYFSSERMAPGVEAPWNNGKYNIWRVALTDEALARLRRASLGGPIPASAP